MTGKIKGSLINNCNWTKHWQYQFLIAYVLWERGKFNIGVLIFDYQLKMVRSPTEFNAVLLKCQYIIKDYRSKDVRGKNL